MRVPEWALQRATIESKPPSAAAGEEPTIVLGLASRYNYGRPRILPNGIGPWALPLRSVSETDLCRGTDAVKRSRPRNQPLYRLSPGTTAEWLAGRAEDNIKANQHITGLSNQPITGKWQSQPSMTPRVKVDQYALAMPAVPKESTSRAASRAETASSGGSGAAALRKAQRESGPPDPVGLRGLKLGLRKDPFNRQWIERAQKHLRENPRAAPVGHLRRNGGLAALQGCAGSWSAWQSGGPGIMEWGSTGHIGEAGSSTLR